MLLYIYKLFLFLNHPVIFYAIKYIHVCHLGFMVIAFCRKSFLSPLYSPPQFLESNMHDFCKEAFIEKSYILNISNFVIFVKILLHVILKFKFKRFYNLVMLYIPTYMCLIRILYMLIKLKKMYHIQVNILSIFTQFSS